MQRDESDSEHKKASERESHPAPFFHGFSLVMSRGLVALPMSQWQCVRFVERIQPALICSIHRHYRYYYSCLIIRCGNRFCGVTLSNEHALCCGYLSREHGSGCRQWQTLRNWYSIWLSMIRDGSCLQSKSTRCLRQRFSNHCHRWGEHHLQGSRRECFEKGRDAGVTLRWLFGKCLEHRDFAMFGEVRDKLSERERRLQGPRCERWTPGQDLVGKATKRVLIALPTDAAGLLLWSHIPCTTGIGWLTGNSVCQNAAGHEISEQRLPIVTEEHIFRLEVGMQDIPGVSIRKGLSHPHHDQQSFAQRDGRRG